MIFFLKSIADVACRQQPLGDKLENAGEGGDFSGEKRMARRKMADGGWPMAVYSFQFTGRWRVAGGS